MSLNAVITIVPSLGDVFAAIGPANVIYGIIDTVSFGSLYLFSYDNDNHCFIEIRN